MGGTVAGHLLVTPLHSERWGKAVLVNRGWVPVEWRSDQTMRSTGQPSGQVRHADSQLGGYDLSPRGSPCSSPFVGGLLET